MRLTKSVIDKLEKHCVIMFPGIAAIDFVINYLNKEGWLSCHIVNYIDNALSLCKCTS